MSTLKTNRTQLGQSSTATQNFTITAEAADGTTDRFAFLGGSMTNWMGWAGTGTWAASAEL